MTSWLLRRSTFSPYCAQSTSRKDCVRHRFVILTSQHKFSFPSLILYSFLTTKNIINIIENFNMLTFYRDNIYKLSCASNWRNHILFIVRFCDLLQLFLGARWKLYSTLSNFITPFWFSLNSTPSGGFRCSFS